MKKYLATIASLLIILAGCTAPATPPAESDTIPAPSLLLSASLAEQANFRFLVSDENNAIGDFQNLYVTISRIGVQPAGNSENWTQFTPAITKFDLKLLTDENATALWAGNITPGRYEKVFIYVSEVSGALASATDNQSVNVKLPSGKLQISKPFTISENTTANFVFDVTVIKTGNDKSGGKYILKPQVEMSGSGQNFREVKAGANPEDKGNKGQAEQERARGNPGAKPEK